jgi:hypothetical protein
MSRCPRARRRRRGAAGPALTCPNRAVKALPWLLVTALLSASLSACGAGTGAGSSPASHDSSAAATISTAAHATEPGGYLKEDADKDGDDGYYPNGPKQDDEQILALYGGKAPAAEARAIAALVKRYYAASVAGNGAGACALLSPGVVAGVVALQQSQTARGSSACATAIAPLLAHQHQRLLAEEPATMVVTGVYAKGELGLALLGFRSAPESDIVVAREGHVWKIDSVFDNQLT